MKDLKYEHQGIFPLLGSVKLNFRSHFGLILEIGTENQYFFLELQPLSSFFIKFSKKVILA